MLGLWILHRNLTDGRNLIQKGINLVLECEIIPF